MADTVPAAASFRQEVFGPYVLLRRLGRGGMAEAYLAERTGPGDFRRRVCVKVILPDSAEDREFISWFMDEAKIHAQLHHEHIVQVYEFGEVEGRNYLALEYVEGCDLRTLMHALEDQKARLPVDLAVHIVYEIATALECAHQLTIDGVPQHLVHRDLSPSNVLLSTQGHAKLSDFGIVKATSRMTRTATGMAKGKVPYMSPEQILSSDIDGRTDLFALGVILFELLSGQHPFRTRKDDLDIAIARRTIEGERPDLRTLAPGLAPELYRIVDQLLARNAGERLGSATALLEVLTPLVPGATAARRLSAYVAAARAETPFAQALAVSGAADSGPVSSSKVVAKNAVGAPPLVPAPASRTKWWALGGSAVLGLSALVLGLALKSGSGSEVATPKGPVSPALPTAANQGAAPRDAPTQAPVVAKQPAAVAAQPAPAVTAPVETTPTPALPTQPSSSAPSTATPAKPPVEVADAAKPARVRVVVLPFGDVQIGDTRRSAPATFELPAGAHTIRAGRTDALLHRKSVRLRAGERKEIVIDLVPGE